MARGPGELPLRGDDVGRFLPWIVGLVVYLTALVLVAALVLEDTAQRFEAGLTGTLTLELPADTSADDAAALAEALQRRDDIARARVLGKSDIAELLEPWLGGEDITGLPLPVLIDLRLPTGGGDIDALRKALAALSPEARLEDHALWRAQFIDRLRIAELVALGIIAINTVVGIVAVIFAIRTGLIIHQRIITLLHGIGASGGYIARQFQRHAFRQGSWGALGGLALLALTLLALAAIGGGGETLAGLELLSPSTLGWIALVPLATVLITMITARLTVLRLLAKMP
jgi:cell division transport system permease protein